MGEFSLNLNATLSIGPRIITTLFLTETTYMEINSPGTSGDAKRICRCQYADSALNLGDFCKDIKPKDLLCLLAHAIYHNG